MKAKALEIIFEELISVYENLKAEVLIAEIQENSDITIDDFVIANKSTFSRSYRRDIINVDNILYDDMLTLNLSRNGLYDTLPEGLFHEQQVSGGAQSYTDRRKVVKEEEQDARLFFAPLESEFFYQRLQVERKERALLDDFYNLKDDFLMNFWKLDINIPKHYILKLIKLLPYSHKIAGDLELTRLCLEKILNEKVSFRKKHVQKTIADNENGFKHAKEGLQLGVNSVLDGDTYEVLYPELEVTIGPILESNINEYLKKEGVLKFINTFYDYFIPMELEVNTKFTVSKEVNFILDDSHGTIMGISTQL